MAIRKIRKIGDPVLRGKSRKVENIDDGILKLANDMIDAVTNGEFSGVGLAAPQIGVSKRVIVVNFEDKPQIYINPEIEILDNQQVEHEEGCLSVYSILCSIKRAKKIRVSAKDLKGKKIKLEVEGMMARIFQHEIDHLHCILMVDHLSGKSKREFLSKINEISPG